MTVSPQPLDITGLSAADKVYDGDTIASFSGTAELAGVVPSDTVQLGTASASAAFADKNAGDGKTVSFAGYTISGAAAADYKLVQPTSTASITPAALTISANGITMTYADGTTLDDLSGYSATGLQAGDVIGSVALATDASLSSSNNWNAGSWTITPSAAVGTAFDAANYNITYVPGTLTVNQATPTISWSNPADITYGTALDATQLNASADIAGTLVYAPVAGTVLNAGSGQTLSVTFTPTDATDYATVTQTVAINVKSNYPHLFNTGTDANHQTTSPTSSVNDIHWTVNGAAAVVPDDADVSSDYLPNDANSRLISFNSTTDETGMSIFNYATTFTMPSGQDPSLLSITGRLIVGDQINDILVNGVSSGVSISGTANPWGAWNSFTLTTGFTSGTNTLTFVVDNGFGNSTGLRVEFL